MDKVNAKSFTLDKDNHKSFHMAENLRFDHADKPKEPTAESATVVAPSPVDLTDES
jgi:hypothetical protein